MFLKTYHFVDMKSFYMFAFHSFVNIFNLPKDLSHGVIRGHHNQVGL